MIEGEYPDGHCGPTPQVERLASISGGVEREMLTVGEVAAMLSIGVRSVWRKAQDGRLPPPIKMTGSTRWAKSTIHDWIADKASAAQKQSRGRHRP
jgi:predicted DNA-binding transcriptional regulator AlpA